MKFITLGPAGNNHELVTRRYLDFHGLSATATLTLTGDFAEAVAAVLVGEADFLVQCAVHPDCTATMAKSFQGLHAVDTFLSPSRDLAIIRRKDAAPTGALAAMSPTLDYIDSSGWDRIDLVPTVSDVAQGLIDGTYVEGLAYASLAEAHPDILKIEHFIGTVDDAWIVYGRTRVTEGRLLAWPDSPASRLYRTQSA